MFLEKLQKKLQEQKTKTDQKMLVLKYVEKAPCFYPASVFHRKWEKIWESFERKNLKEKIKLPKKPKRNKKFYQFDHFRSELIALLIVLPMIQDGNF